MSKVKYDASFKQNAVSLVEAGTPASRVARNLGISAHLVYAWHRQYGAKPSTHGNASENQSEVTQLRKQLERAQAELDILKKAVGIFSRPNR
jgi:transposase-like protein